MRALGWQKKNILFTSGIGALTLTLAGCLAGIVLGLVVAFAMGSFETALILPWNLNPTPVGIHHGGAGQSMQVPLPVALQPVTIIFGLAVICLAAVITGVLSAARLTGMEVRRTLREQ